MKKSMILLLRHVILLAIILSAISFSAITQSGLSPGKQLSQKELIEDLKSLNKAVNNTHPITINPAWSNKLDSLITGIEQNAKEKISVFEYNQIIQQAVSLIGCYHTSVIKSPFEDYVSKKIKETGNCQFFPLRLFADSTGLSIIKLDYKSPDSSIQFPFQVISINGISAQELIYSISLRFPQDGYKKTLAYQILNNHGAYFLRQYFYDNNRILIRGKSENGKEFKLTIDAVQTYNNKLFRHYQPEGKPIINEKDISLFDLGSTSAYLKLKTVMYENYETTHKAIFEYLELNKKSNLIIDLRGNGGGNQNVYLDFLSYLSLDSLRIEMVKRNESGPKLFNSKRYNDNPLKESYNRFEKIENGTKYFINPIPPKSTIFHGHLYVLIDGETASGASQLASFLKNSMNAICVGQETGGGETGNNGHGYDELELPNSKIKIRWPRYNVKIGLSIPTNLSGVKPNFEIKYDPKNYLLNRDLEMEKVSELIDNLN